MILNEVFDFDPRFFRFFFEYLDFDFHYLSYQLHYYLLFYFYHLSYHLHQNIDFHILQFLYNLHHHFFCHFHLIVILKCWYDLSYPYYYNYMVDSHFLFHFYNYLHLLKNFECAHPLRMIMNDFLDLALSFFGFYFEYFLQILKSYFHFLLKCLCCFHCYCPCYSHHCFVDLSRRRMVLLSHLMIFLFHLLWVALSDCPFFWG